MNSNQILGNSGINMMTNLSKLLSTPNFKIHDLMDILDSLNNAQLLFALKQIEVTPTEHSLPSLLMFVLEAYKAKLNKEINATTTSSAS